MDQNKVNACVSKLRTLSGKDQLSCIYQWVLTKHIRLDEFAAIAQWIIDERAKIGIKPIDVPEDD